MTIALENEEKLTASYPQPSQLCSGLLRDHVSRNKVESNRVWVCARARAHTHTHKGRCLQVTPVVGTSQTGFLSIQEGKTVSRVMITTWSGTYYLHFIYLRISSGSKYLFKSQSTLKQSHGKSLTSQKFAI